MVKLVDHLVQGLHIDIEKRKQESAQKKQRMETQLYKLLTELVETERKYVKDLEKVGLKYTSNDCVTWCLMMHPTSVVYSLLVKSCFGNLLKMFINPLRAEEKSRLIWQLSIEDDFFPAYSLEY